MDEGVGKEAGTMMGSLGIIGKSKEGGLGEIIIAMEDNYL